MVSACSVASAVCCAVAACVPAASAPFPVGALAVVGECARSHWRRPFASAAAAAASLICGCV